MHSITIPTPFFLFPNLKPSSFFPPLFFPSGSTRRVQQFAVLTELDSVLKKGNCYKGLNFSCSGVFLRRCKGEGEFSSLESEILEFMRNSDKPGAFPTKNELLAAGRFDLVDAIVKKGGWLTFGWDLNEGSSEIQDFQDGSSRETDGNATRASGVAPPPSSSAKPVKTEAENSGIEGILKRLEKERSNSFGVGFRDGSVSSENNEEKNEWDHRATIDAVAGDLHSSSRPSSSSQTSNPFSGFQTKHDQNGSHLDTGDLRNSLKPDWRSWVIQRNGFSGADFEAAEIVPGETPKGGVSGVSRRPDMFQNKDPSYEPINQERGLYSLDGNANHSDIKSRIQHMELELSSVLNSLRSRADKVTMETDQMSSSDDLGKLSDAWEFQENEIIHAKDKLRSLRAKLAVLEGKMSLAIMDAHKVVEEKQKKINKAQKALQILKTTYVVWPNAASEVFLAGSFDGWSTQRKMQKSVTGVFSVCLQLYPGKYEIKFIVDGEWKVDPLRPIVNSGGYENNLLVVHN